MTEKQALHYPLIRAFALEAWNVETNPYTAVERLGAGYIAQEARKALKS